MHVSRIAPFALGLALSASCAGAFARKPPESVEIFSRTEVSQSVSVKHVLIGWSWLDATYRRDGLTLDPRAENRNQTDAEQLAQDILAKVRAGTPIETLMAQYSEDEGSAKSGIAYPVTPQSRLVPDFIELALRLNVGEAGITRSKYGFHVIERVK